MRARFLACVALALGLGSHGCGGDEDAGLSVDIRLDQGARDGLPIRVDIYLVDSCEAVVPGVDPETVIAQTFQLSDLTTGPPLSNVGPGDYGLYVIARDRDCFVVGAQCDSITVTEEDTAAVSITVPSFAGAGCASEEICVDATGECTSPGTGGTGGAGGSGGALVDTCDGEAEGAFCDGGTAIGRCRSGSCCTGCWDGSTCYAGDSNVRCGVGGTSCTLCQCFSDVCEAGACAPSNPFTDVDLGLDHACAIGEDGHSWCWGYDNRGQIGTGGSTPATCDGSRCTRPTEMNVLIEGSVPRWNDISAGEEVTCAIRASDSSLWCWGSNADGRMGASDTVSSSDEPVLIDPSAHTEVDNEERSGCAIRMTDSSLWCWGENSRGQVGQGSTGADVYGPTQVPYGTTWDQVSVGDEFVLAVSEGWFWGWGYNNDGELGTGATGGTTHPGVTGFAGSAPEAGKDTACALDVLGAAHCWGANSRGQVGNGEATFADVTTPALVSGNHRFDHFALGDSFSCAVTTAGALYCWGYNRYEQLGVGQAFWDLSQSAEPMRVGSDSDWTKVSAGGDSACGLRENGTLWCWGRNHRGQLGLGDTDDRASPTRLCF